MSRSNKNYWIGSTAEWSWNDLEGIDLWDIDGFGEYFDSAEKLNTWINFHFWPNHPTISHDDEEFLSSYGDDVVNQSEIITDDGYEQAEYFLRTLNTNVYLPTDDITNSFFYDGITKLESLMGFVPPSLPGSGSGPIRSTPTPPTKKEPMRIPWSLLGLVAIIFLWRK